MRTTIKSTHEEHYSDGRTLGILTNFNANMERINSFVYLFREEMYIFFETIVDMNDYLLYGDSRVKRSYMKEVDFDEIYDNGINGEFNDLLKWV